MKINERGYNMEKKHLFGIFALAIIAILGVSLVSAFGFQGGMSDENKEIMKTAVENGDFDSWKAIKQAELTEEKFAKLQERHEIMEELKPLKEQMRAAMQEGDSETAETLRAQIRELLPEGFKGQEKGKGHGGINGFKRGNCPIAE
jgi:hypothetical protein